MDELYQKRGDSKSYIRIHRSKCESEKRYTLSFILNKYNQFNYIYNLYGHLKRINDITNEKYSGYMMTTYSLDDVIDFLNEIKICRYISSNPQKMKSLYDIKHKVEIL